MLLFILVSVGLALFKELSSKIWSVLQKTPHVHSFLQICVLFNWKGTLT